MSKPLSHFVKQVLAAIAVLAFSSNAAFSLDTFPGTTLTGASGSVTGSNTGMTGQTGEPQIVDGSAANIHSYWYSWTAPSAGLFTIATCNPTGSTTTNYDTTLGTYTGATVNAPLTTIATNDDTTDCFINGGSALGSSNSFTAVAGTTYRFRVDGYQASQGNYALYWGYAGLTVATTDSVTSEAPALGDTGTFTVRLNSPPAGNGVVVAIGASSPASQCTFAPTSLTFTPSNWQITQTVTVTAFNDATVEGTHTCRPATITATGSGYTTTTSTPTPIFTINDDENPAFTITKAVSAANISAPGVLTYTITVDNTGNALLTSPVITDAMTFNGGALALTSGPTLTSGDTNSNGRIEDTETWIYTATATATQAHFDGTGNYSNTATFDTLETAASTSTAAVTTLTRTATFTIGKIQNSGPSPVTAAGQTIGYRVTVTNTGTQTLTGTAFTDTFQLNGVARTLTTGPTLSGDLDSDTQLDVGEIWLYNATYIVPQTDIDGTGSFTNVATFDTTQTPLSTSPTVTTPVTRTASFTIGKVQFAGPNPVTAAGQTLTYRVTVTNTGNQTLTAPVFTDTFQLNGAARTLTTGPTLSGDTDTDGQVDLTEVWLYTATYVVPQSDIDGTGSFTNVATFDTAQTPLSTSPTVTTPVTRTASFTIGKVQFAGPNPVTAAGQTLTYRVTITNTGNQTLTVPVFTDTFQLNGAARTFTTGPTLSGDTDSDSQVDLTEVWLYTATYIVPQTDIDGTGSFTNVATFDTAQTPLSTSPTVTTPVTRTASFTIGKVQFAGPNPVTAAGQTLTYRVTVTNTGNQTLTVPVFTDTFQLNGAARTLTTGPTLSGDTDTDGQVDLTEVWLYTATYVVPQTDIDGTGSFTNVATFDTNQTPLSTSNTVTTPVTRTASFSILKAQSGGPNPITAQNQTITYLITVQNTGNQTLTGLVMTDTLLQGASPRTLATGPVYASGDTDSDGGIDTTEIWLYNATYIVSLSDMNNGSTFSNTASLDTTQTALQTSAAVTTPVTQTPLITMTKTGVYLNGGDDVNGNGFADAGDLVTYQYVVSNGGNVTITNISVADIHNGVGTLSSVTPATVASLAPSANTTFQATYVVKQGDVDAQ